MERRSKEKILTSKQNVVFLIILRKLRVLFFFFFIGAKLKMLDDHKGWVNGVCWDPLNQFIATISSDRILRVYNTKNYKNLCKTYKAQLPIDAVCPQTQNGKVISV